MINMLLNMFGLLTHAELERRLQEHSEKLELEWTEWYDKFRRLYARIAKRQQQIEEAEADGEGAPVGRGLSAERPLGPGADRAHTPLQPGYADRLANARRRFGG